MRSAQKNPPFFETFAGVGRLHLAKGYEMRKLLSSTLTLLLLAAAAYADDAQNAAKGGDDEIRSAFSKLDVETRSRLMKKFDKDGDGKLNAEERRAMFEDARQRRANLIKKYDKDGDGVLNDAEREELIKDPEVKDMMKRMLSRPFPPPPPQNRD